MYKFLVMKKKILTKINNFKHKSNEMFIMRLPDKLLFARKIYFKEEMLKIACGISPFKHINPASKFSNKIRFPISFGISPIN